MILLAVQFLRVFPLISIKGSQQRQHNWLSILEFFSTQRLVFVHEVLPHRGTFDSDMNSAVERRAAVMCVAIVIF